MLARYCAGVAEGVNHQPAADQFEIGFQNFSSQRFEHSFLQGSRPVIEDYLPTSDPLRSRVLIELVHVDLELRLKAGDAVRVEDYLARHPALASDRAAALELIAAEHELRRRREPGLTLAEYLQRFPQYRAELPEQIEGPTVAAGDTPPCPADRS